MRVGRRHGKVSECGGVSEGGGEGGLAEKTPGGRRRGRFAKLAALAARRYAELHLDAESGSG